MNAEWVVNGVKQGDPCWVVPSNPPGPPIWVESAYLCADGKSVYVLHDACLYPFGSVFRNEQDAQREAVSAAVAHRDYLRDRLAEVERAIAALGGVDEPVENSLEDVV